VVYIYAVYHEINSVSALGHAGGHESGYEIVSQSTHGAKK